MVSRDWDRDSKYKDVRMRYEVKPTFCITLNLGVS